MIRLKEEENLGDSSDTPKEVSAPHAPDQERKESETHEKKDQDGIEWSHVASADEDDGGYEEENVFSTPPMEEEINFLNEEMRHTQKYLGIYGGVDEEKDGRERGKERGKEGEGVGVEGESGLILLSMESESEEDREVIIHIPTKM